MTKPRLRLVTPATVNRTVTRRRPKNGEVRTREHLTEDEVEKLIEAAKNNRHGHRDALMVLLTYRHGLRAAEVVDLPDPRSLDGDRRDVISGYPNPDLAVLVCSDQTVS